MQLIILQLVDFYFSLMSTWDPWVVKILLAGYQHNIYEIYIQPIDNDDSFSWNTYTCVSWDSKGYPELRMEISACVYFYIVLPRMFMAYLHICYES